MTGRGLPFIGFSDEERKNIEYVISDVDDTITKNGKLYPLVLDAMYRLKMSGRTIVLVTGGSTGWGDAYIRQWPVDAVICESGAVMLCHDRNGGITSIINPVIKKDEVMEKRRALIERTAPYPFSSDQCARVFDIAYDKAMMTDGEIRTLKNILSAHGANSAESSIHINAWFGTYNKKSALKFFMEKCLSIKEGEYLKKSIYLGDSFNDQPLFRYIPVSIGMHTVEERRDGFEYLPLYITTGTSGDGWVEVVNALVEGREDDGEEEEENTEESEEKNN